MDSSKEYVRWFGDLGLSDVPIVGGKNASLGEMHRHLVSLGVRVPDGFAVTADAYKDTLSDRDWTQLHELLDGINKENKDVANVHAVAAKCREIVYKAALSPELEKQILEGYRKLSKDGKPASVAVRSSATAEDLPDASFAGQHESFLNIVGEKALLDAYRKCCASLFTERAISYRLDKGFDHFKGEFGRSRASESPETDHLALFCLLAFPCRSLPQCRNHANGPL